jgi:hypothetical protein
MTLDPEWISARLDLFEKFAIPSVDNQVNKNFTWFVIVNEDTDEESKKRIESLYDYKVVYVDDYWWRKSFYPVLNELTTNDYMIQTRFDSDDAIHKDFIDEIQKIFSKKTVIVDIPNGYAHYYGSVIYGYLKLNQFTSLIKRSDDNNNIYDVGHDSLDKIAPVVTIEDKRLWLATIHELNTAMVANTYTDLDFKRDVIKIHKQIQEINKEQLSKDFGIPL